MANPTDKTGFTHEKIETNNFLMIVLILLVIMDSQAALWYVFICPVHRSSCLMILKR